MNKELKSIIACTFFAAAYSGLWWWYFGLEAAIVVFIILWVAAVTIGAHIK